MLKTPKNVLDSLNTKIQKYNSVQLRTINIPLLMVGSYDKCYYNQVIKRNQVITLNHNINITKTD